MERKNAEQEWVEVAIAVVFEREGRAKGARRLLICKRKADMVLGGYWEFPGGKCQTGEVAAACAVREVEEETGLRVEVLAALSTIEHAYPHARVRLHPFVCAEAGGVLELRAVAEARWIDAGQVEAYQFPEANGPLLKRVRLGLDGLLAGRAPD